MSKDFESRIDALFQLPLDEFTAARNALAKEAGKDAPALKQLTKPPVAAWAVNQLYWERRDDYEALGGHMEHIFSLEQALARGAWQEDGAPLARQWVVMDDANPWPLGHAPMLG